MSPEVKGFRGLITHLLGFAGTQHLSGLFEQVSFLWQWEIRLWWRTEALHHDKGGFDLSLESHTLPKVWVSELIIDGGISPLSKLTACCLPLKGDGLLFLNWLDRGSRIYLCNNWIPFYSLYVWKPPLQDHRELGLCVRHLGCSYFDYNPGNIWANYEAMCWCLVECQLENTILECKGEGELSWDWQRGMSTAHICHKWRAIHGKSMPIWVTADLSEIEHSALVHQPSCFCLCLRFVCLFIFLTGSCVLCPCRMMEQKYAYASF